MISRPWSLDLEPRNVHRSWCLKYKSLGFVLKSSYEGFPLCYSLAKEPPRGIFNKRLCSVGKGQRAYKTTITVPVFPAWTANLVFISLCVAGINNIVFLAKTFVSSKWNMDIACFLTYTFLKACIKLSVIDIKPCFACLKIKSIFFVVNER